LHLGIRPRRQADVLHPDRREPQPETAGEELEHLEPHIHRRAVVGISLTTVLLQFLPQFSVHVENVVAPAPLDGTA
jgi:hypothetical protein